MPGFVGSFGSLTGEVITYGGVYEWTPPDGPRETAQALLQVADYVDNVRVPLIEALAIARGDTEHRFESETDPDGQEWYPLDEDYLTTKINEGYPETILTRRGDLSAAAPHGWVLIENTLVYDPSVLPTDESGRSYGLMHQTGSGDAENVGRAGENRDYFRFLRQNNQRREEHEGRSGHESLDIGRGNALPARPWIGLTEEAIDAIALAFDEWFAQAPTVFEERFFNPNVGRTFVAVRGPGGRFAKGSHFI